MTDNALGDDDDSSLLALLWGQRRVATRGPAARLTVEQIVQVASEIADSEGVEAVSMQRVATGLGYSKMSLYRYVATKDELLAVMIDAAVGAPPDVRSVRGGWRRRVEAYAGALWETWQQHPWLPSVTVGARVMGPNEVGWVEQSIAALDDTGLSADDKIDAVLLVSAHVRMRHSLASTGTFPWSAKRQLRPQMMTLIRQQPERFRAVLDVVDAASGREWRGVSDGLGLGTILDGLEVRIAQQRAGTGRRTKR